MTPRIASETRRPSRHAGPAAVPFTLRRYARRRRHTRTTTRAAAAVATVADPREVA